MTGFLIFTIVVIVLVVFFWLIERALDGSRVATVAVYFALFLIFGLVINYATKSEAKGPRYEKEPSHDSQ